MNFKNKNSTQTKAECDKKALRDSFVLVRRWLSEEIINKNKKKTFDKIKLTDTLDELLSTISQSVSLPRDASVSRI